MTQRLTNQLRLALEPECLENPTATTREIPRDGADSIVGGVGRDLGVDVELIRSDIASEEIASRYFAPREVAELQSLPPSARAEGFFLCWTRKEAYIKAVGDGLQISLASFRVSLVPSQPPCLESADSSRWTLRSLSPAPDYVGALVGEGKDWQLHCFDWQPRDGG